MKTLSIAFAALIVMSIGAQAASSVTSVNIVGYNSMALEAGKRYIVSAPLYDPAGDGTNTLLSVFGSDQLVQAANYFNADQVIIFDTSTSMYQAYAQYTDGSFYKCNTAQEWIDSVLSDDVVVDVGQSFWIAHPAGASASELSLIGEVLGGPSDTQDVAIVPGYQLAANPYAVEKQIQDIAKMADGATADANYFNSDQIVTWDVASQTYQTYGLYTDDVWYKANNAQEWIDSIPATGSVSMGGGFWYISKTVFTLTDACPYSAAY